MLRDTRLDTFRVLDEAENNADGDETEDSIDNVEQLKGAWFLGGRQVALHFLHEAVGEVHEYEDEELL